MTFKKILYFALGPIGGALLGFILLPIVAWYFSQDDVGRMALLNVVLSFTTLFFTLGLDQAYVREYHVVENKARLLKATVLPGFIFLFFTLSASLFGGPFLADVIFSINSTNISWLLAVTLLCSFLSRFLSLVLRMNENGLAFSMCQLLPKLFVLLVIVAYILLDCDRTFELLLLANTLAVVMACMIFSWNTRREWRFAFSEEINWQELQKMLRFGLPLIVGGIAFWGLTSLDRIMLSRWGSYSELAVYSVSVSFAAVATIFQSVFSTVWAPTVYRWARESDGDDKVIAVTRYVLLLVISLFCLAGLLSWFVPLILPKQYTEVQWILVACLAYPLFYTLSETTVVGIGITRRSVYAMISCILAFLVNIVCNYALIPLYGAAGAASSIALSFWVFLVFRTEFSIRVWKPQPRGALYSFTFLAVLGSILSALKQEELGYFIYLYWGGLLITCSLLFMKEIKVVKETLLGLFMK